MTFPLACFLIAATVTETELFTVSPPQEERAADLGGPVFSGSASPAAFPFFFFFFHSAFYLPLPPSLLRRSDVHYFPGVRVRHVTCFPVRCLLPSPTPHPPSDTAA